MQHSSSTRSTPRLRILVALTLLAGTSILSACGPVAPPKHPADPAPTVLEPGSSSSEVRDNAQAPAEALVGSSKGKTFHRTSCEWAKKIRHPNLIQFRDADDAVKKGYAPCRTCLPR